MALVFLGRRSRGLYFLPREGGVRVRLSSGAVSGRYPGVLSTYLSSINSLGELTLVELAQVLLLLLVHDDVDPGDGLPHHPDLGQLGGRAPGHLQQTSETGLDK